MNLGFLQQPMSHRASVSSLSGSCLNLRLRLRLTSAYFKMSVSYQERFERNTEASTCHRNQQPFSGAPSSAELDGSLKKNSAMVTKLKTLNGDSAARLEAELLKLKFDKFIHEFAHALAEACTKLRSDADVEGWIAVSMK